MELMDQTIKRLYDEYKPQDFVYGQAGSDNLNPKREMVMNQVELIERKVQEITNDIVLKKIRAPKPEAEKVKVSTNGESPSGQNFARKTNAVRTGSPTLNILEPLDVSKQLEEIIGSFPGSANDLALPPIIACQEILKKYDFNEKSYSVFEVVANDGEQTIVIKTEGDGIDSDDNSDGSTDIDALDDETNDCAEIELEFLKIILIICKIIKVLMTIIDIVISTIVMVIQIVCLAVGAWLNPPNIAQIIQIIIGMVMSLVLKIISKLIQMIWNMLNLDCLADQVMETIAQIQECLNAFQSTLAMLDPSAVTFLGDLINGGMQDIRDIIEELMKAKAEAWEDAQKELRDTFSAEGLEKIKDQCLKEAEDAALASLNEVSGGRAQALYNQSAAVVDQATSIAKEAKDKYDQMVKAFTDAHDLLRKTPSASSGSSDVDAITKDPTVKGLKMERSEKKEKKSSGFGSLPGFINDAVQAIV